MEVKKSEIKKFIKKQGDFDEYIIDSFIKYCKDYLNYYESLEDAYKEFNDNSPIFHECGLSDLDQKIYPIRLFYDDNGYHFLDNKCSAIVNSYHFVYRFKNMEDAVEYTKRNPREKKDNSIVSLAQGLSVPKKSSLRWWVLKDESPYDSIGNVRWSPLAGGLYRHWAATYTDNQVMYHNEQYYWEGSGWENAGYGPTEVHEIPDDFYERYREVNESDCSQGSGAWYCNWNFSKSKAQTDKTKPSKKQKTKKDVEEPKSTQDVIIDKIAELKAKSVISDEVADVLDLIVSYISTKSDIDHNHNE